MAARRRQALLASALLEVALAACSGTASPTPSSLLPPTAVIEPAPRLDAPCEPGGGPVTLTAVGLAYQPTCVAATADERFELVFHNQDAGIPHNIRVVAGPRNYATNPPTLLVTPQFSGDRTRTYTVGSLPAGLYSFHCDVHPDLMHGLFAVAPTASPSSGPTGTGFVVSWVGASDAPKDYVFDVEVREPGSASFRMWLSRQEITHSTFTASAPGTYAFRVAAWPANGEVQPIGYSPPATVQVVAGGG
jgi:plastocyanin